MATHKITPCKVVTTVTDGDITLTLSPAEAIVLKELLDGLAFRTAHTQISNTTEPSIGEKCICSIIEVLNNVPSTDDYIFTIEDDYVVFTTNDEKSLINAINRWPANEIS